MRLLLGLGSTLVLLPILVFSWGDAPAIVPQDTTDASDSLQTQRDILFTSRRAAGSPLIWRMEPDGSNPRPVTTRDSVMDNLAVWSPDGRQIAFLSNRDEPEGKSGIYVMNADGSEVRAVGPRSWQTMSFPEWSPDGEQLLFSAGTGAEAMDLYVMDADGSDVRQLTSKPGLERCGHWGPDGKRIIYPWTKGDTTMRLMLLDRDSGETRPVLPEGVEARCAYWAPGGDRIAFASPPDLDWPSRQVWNEEGPQPLEIFVYHLQGDSLTQLTDAGALSNYPRWSPDGRRIVFQSTRASDGEFFEEPDAAWYDVYVMNADGTEVRRLTKNQVFDAHPNW